MVTELQFVAIAAFLVWCLISSLCGVLTPAATEAQLIWREHGPHGWLGWREVHFGLTAANLRILDHPDGAVDREACAGLFDTVLHQARRVDADAVQFAIIRRSPERIDGDTTVVFVSDRLAVGSPSPSTQVT
jgi:hypothetical protein